MPIRLNLLAEAQAAEELRRRDPVKRAIWIACALVALMLIWSSSLYVKAMVANGDLSKVQNEVNSITNDFKVVTDNRNKAAEVAGKLEKLQVLSTNRFLCGTLMNALQKSTMEDIQITHLKLNNEYAFIEESKPSTNGTRVVAGKPARITEKNSLEIDGMDSSSSPGDLVAKYKELLASSSYFKEGFFKPAELNLKSFSPPTLSPETGRQCVLFKIECRFPEKTR